MLRRKRFWGTLVLTVALVAGALLAVGVASWLGADVAPSATHPLNSSVPQGEALADANLPPVPEEVSDEIVETAPADLPIVCATLDEDQHRVPTQACMDALEAHFLPVPASRTILPVLPPLVWSDVFRGIDAKIEAVDAALADDACDVPDGEIWPELGDRCSARAMAALHVLREVCSLADVRGIDPHFSLSPRGFDLDALDLAGWDRVDRTFYRTNVDGAGRDRILQRWAERASDQRTWAMGKQQLDDLYYRTAWKRARCQVSAPMLDWMSGERWDGLLARAARLGDAFALAHHLGSRAHAAKLLELDAPQAQLHLASLDLRELRDAWQKKYVEGGLRIAEEVHEDRIRLLTLAGIDCGDCTVESVGRAFHYTFDYHFRQCAEVKCANLEAMRHLRVALRQPFNELVSTRSTRSLPYRKRAEAVGVKYALAVETFALADGESFPIPK